MNESHCTRHQEEENNRWTYIYGNIVILGKSDDIGQQGIGGGLGRSTLFDGHDDSLSKDGICLGLSEIGFTLGFFSHGSGTSHSQRRQSRCSLLLSKRRIDNAGSHRKGGGLGKEERPNEQRFQHDD